MDSEQRVQPVNAAAERFSRLSWDDVRIFMAVAKLGSLRAAALDRGVSVNTMRARLERMEQAIGSTLVRRSTRGIALTEAGEQMLQMSEAMGRAATQNAVKGSGDVLLKAGQVTIGCSEGTGILWLTPRIGALNARLPHLTVNLAFDYDLARDRAHESDVWLTFEQPKAPDLITSKLATVHFVVFASEGYIARRGLPESVDDLRNHTIVEHVGPGVRSELLDYLVGEDRPDGFIALRTNSSLAQLWAVAEGVGLAGMPSYVREITTAIVPVPPNLQIRRELRLVYRSEARDTPAVRVVVEWLRECFDRTVYPCFDDRFVDPLSFTPGSGGGNVVRLFASTFDRIE